MPFSNPQDRNAYMRDYRRRQRSALASRPRARVLEPEYLPEPRAMLPAPLSLLPSSGRCPYCSGSGRSSAGTICNYCRPPVGAVSLVRAPSSFVQDGIFNPLAVWAVVVGLVGALALLLWLSQRSPLGREARLDSSPSSTWVHWMEGVQL